MRFIYFLMLVSTLQPAWAKIYSAPEEGSRLIGEPMVYQVNAGQSMNDIAVATDMGMLALMAANPGVDPYLPPADLMMELPSQMLLPKAPRKGIVINLAELRLFYFDNANDQVYVFPIGIGRVGRATPLTTTRISEKIKDPTWRPTANTRREWLATKGEVLPASVPPGPDNPLGHRALRLSVAGGLYLIHGTNQDFGIGLRVSAGCIRLRPKDIETLFDLVKVGEQVRIVHQPVKMSHEPTGLFLEVHEPLSKGSEVLTKEEKRVNLTQKQETSLQNQNVDIFLVENILYEQRGLPYRIN